MGCYRRDVIANQPGRLNKAGICVLGLFTGSSLALAGATLTPGS